MGCLTFVLAGCFSGAQKASPGLHYLSSAPFALRVGRVVVEEPPASGRDPKNVGKRMSFTPKALLDQWAQEAFKPLGGEVYARVTIEDASIQETRLPFNSLLSLVFPQPAERYKGRLSVRIDMVDGMSNQSRGYVQVSTSAQRDAADGLSFNERRAIWQKLMEEMLNALDVEVRRILQRDLPAYVG